MVNSCCNANNFSQLVKAVTRVQYNAVSNTTDVFCIDHLYTNAKYRSSTVTVTSFGSSDHDMIGYTISLYWTGLMCCADLILTRLQKSVLENTSLF